MSIKGIKIVTVLVLVIALSGVLYIFVRQQQQQEFPKAYSVDKVWNLPRTLDEVSGISWLNDNTLLMVQDELGILYVFNLETNAIVREILFGDDGDFEAVTVAGKDAYVMRSDGTIFQIENFMEENPKVNRFKSTFSSINNMESMAYNKENGTLVVTPKEQDVVDDYKGLYEIFVSDWTMDTIPSVTIQMRDTALARFRKRKIDHTFNPSDIAIHPQTGKYYVLDGRRPKLLVMQPSGNIEKVYRLDRKEFPQPEGLTFSARGDLYISNESTGGVATIIKVTLNE